jgi:spermidine synthase / saccharopine dehydrogenase (NADP+, L-glutamate-forming)
MITHLPLASHPNPKKVLVIGGGDGGVVREVLKHSSVEEVVLCDIDEVCIQILLFLALPNHFISSQAVPRVSKQYLPHMASVLADARVTVHIGDGFKFLATHESTYDAIITDSSDPVGPAQSLFQKPYFQLLHDALAPGGHISTQGECLWIHLPLIANLRTMTAGIFPVAEYAYTTIPTYPSGQIGFFVCSKEPGRDLRTPQREVQGTLYYNKAIHSAAFVLPEFAQKMLDTGSNILPKFGRVAAAEAAASKPKRKVLLLGSGFVARPCAEYIVRDPSNTLTIGVL